ncbi:MAG TPA: glycosyltransferase [Nitrospirales bacterium]|nr:glycosyltransferase [Nitrospirales bacterium]
MTVNVLQTESALELGGEEFRVLAEVEGLVQRGHRVILALRPNSQLQGLASAQGVPVETVMMEKWLYPIAILFLVRLISRYTIDIVHTHGSRDSWIAAIAGRLSRRKPVIIRTRHKSVPIADNFLNRILYTRLTDRIITTGERVRQDLIQRNRFDGSRIVSIPTGVDLGLFRPRPDDGAFRAELGIAPQEFLVGMVSFLRDYKGYRYYIEAARLVLEREAMVRFLIVGDGPEQEALRAQIDQLGLTDRVIMTGHREDIPNILSALDLFVLTSIDAEGLPQVITQALAMEKPVVASNVGAVSEVVMHGQTGLLVPPRDPDAMAEQILLLMKDRDLGRRLAYNGRRLVEERYSLATMLDRVEALYKGVLAELLVCASLLDWWLEIGAAI